MSDLYDTGFGANAGRAARAVAACLALGLAALGGGCRYSDANIPYCEQAFLGGCLKNPDAPARAVAPANPVAVSQPTVAPAMASPPAAVAPAPVGLGDPGAFADVDDKQCRSYGLAFGSRDYADCRLRLSAQHRGLDPGIGTGGASR